MKAISQKNKKLSLEIISIVERELKLFYFNAFKRRSKNLLTLELIKECYADQINFFIDEIKKMHSNLTRKLFKDINEELEINIDKIFSELNSFIISNKNNRKIYWN